MNFWRVLERDDVLALMTMEAEFLHRCGCIHQELLLVRRIDPRAGDDARPIPRTDLRLERIDDAIERDTIDEPLVDQKRLQRFDPQREIGGDGLLIEILARPPQSGRRTRHDPGGTGRRRLEKATTSN